MRRQAAPRAKNQNTPISMTRRLQRPEDQTIALVNKERSAAGLSALDVNQGLEQCAEVRAVECATSYSHTRPDGSDWWTVNSDLMYGENLASNYTSAQAVVNAWMASPAHKVNIMNSGYSTIGLAFGY